MKGAVDGGLDIPHSVNRLVGYDSEAKTLNADTLRKYIFGGHVADYQKSLKEENSEKYSKLFGAYVKAGIKPEDIENKWTACHKAIKADPAPKPKAKKEGKPKRYNKTKKNLKQRKERVRQVMETMAKKKLAAAQDKD